MEYCSRAFTPHSIPSERKHSVRTLKLGALGIGCCLVVSLSASLAAAANGFGAKGSPAPAIAEESQAEALLKVTLPPGWNMVSFTALAAAFPPPPALAVGPAYTLQAGDSDYESLPQPGTPGQELLRIGGFWIYLGRAAQISFTPGGRDRLAEILPPSQFVMIGNPSSEPATVFGADVSTLTTLMKEPTTRHLLWGPAKAHSHTQPQAESSS